MITSRVPAKPRWFSPALSHPDQEHDMSKKVSKKVVSLKKEIKARKAKISKQAGKLKKLKKKLKKAA